MYFANWSETLSLAVKQSGRWGCYVNCTNLDMDDKADQNTWEFIVKWFDNNWCILGSMLEGGVFFFDTEKECYEFFKALEQTLTDHSSVYACTVNPMGEIETENT